MWKINLKLFFAILTASIALVCVAGFTMAQTQLPERIYQHFFAPSKDADVEVLATPNYSGRAPTALEVTFISPTQIDIRWTKGGSQNNTMIRVADNDYPADVTDGYLLYYDTGSSWSDNATNFDEYFGKKYYRAWGDNSTDGWSTTFVSAELENPAVDELVTQMSVFNSLIPWAMGFLALVLLSVISFWKPNVILFMITGAMAILFGFNWYKANNINMGLSIGLVLVVFGLYCFAMGFRMIFWDRREE